MYSLYANNIAAMMSMSFLQTYLPTYYKDVLLLDLNQVALLFHFVQLDMIDFLEWFSQRAAIHLHDCHENH